MIRCRTVPRVIPETYFSVPLSGSETTEDEMSEGVPRPSVARPISSHLSLVKVYIFDIIIPYKQERSVFMPKEIETKFKIGSPKAFRKKLKKIKAKFVSKEYEQDVYYKKKGIGFPVTVIRLRTINKKMGLFTVKVAKSRKKAKTFKIRDEFEISIADTKVFSILLRKLGFIPGFIKEKKRETYLTKGAKIVLDQLPYIGWYTEIEACQKRIKELALALGLDINKAIPVTYGELFKKYQKANNKPNLELVF